MAHTTIYAGNVGATIDAASDTVSAEIYPLVKVAHGAATSAASIVSATSPLPVEIFGSTTSSGYSIYRLLSAATTNATNVKGSAGKVIWIAAFSLVGSVRFLKLYNKATAPAPATDNALLVMTLPIPANGTAGSGFILPPFINVPFASGIGFAITANVGDTDNTAVAANDVVLNMAWI